MYAIVEHVKGRSREAKDAVDLTAVSLGGARQPGGAVSLGLLALEVEETGLEVQFGELQTAGDAGKAEVRICFSSPLKLGEADCSLRLLLTGTRVSSLRAGGSTLGLALDYSRLEIREDSRTAGTFTWEPPRSEARTSPGPKAPGWHTRALDARAGVDGADRR